MACQPMLCRVRVYCDPGFPKPTTSFTNPPGSQTGPDPVREGLPGWYQPDPSGWLSVSSGEQSGLEGAHGGLVRRFGMVPAAQMEGAVDRQQPKLVGG